MRRLISLAIIGALAISPAHAAAAPASPAVQKDVTCFLLFAAATDKANEANEDKQRQALSMALTYYLGKLAVEAPGLDLAGAVRQQMAALQKSPNAKEIGASCDSEFAKAGKDLRDLGQELQKGTPEAAPPK